MTRPPPKQRPTDVRLPRRVVEARAKAPGCLASYEAAAYHVDEHWLMFAAEAHADLVKQYRTTAERLGVRVMPPGAWLAAMIKGAVRLATLGIVSIQPCSSCDVRMKAMNAAGWLGLPRLLWRWTKNRIQGVTP